MANSQENTPIQVGISACLMGHKVRYDGGHKRNSYCQDVLARHFEFIPICPEQEAGLGVPRPSIQLIQSDAGIQAIAPGTGQNVTSGLQQVLENRVRSIEGMSGYILIHKSPSCGLFRTRIYTSDKTMVKANGRGIYAHSLTSRFPLLPVEEADRLNDPHIRENFLQRVFAYHHWQNITKTGLRKKDVIDFYSHYKYIMLAHSHKHYKDIGKLLSGVDTLSLDELKTAFITLFMDGLACQAKRSGHSNSLYHLQGYFKDHLTAEEKNECVQLIESYRKNHLPLVAPMVLLKHLLRKYPNAYLENQKYFNPYPESLGLRNHI